MEEAPIKISVVTVCFNAVDAIEETILSVLNQTYRSIEYIIIDGGSTDGTVDIIKKYADKLAYWISEPDKGIYDAMNKGIKVATGDYINFMNAGDKYIHTKTIEMLLENHGDEKILYGNIIRCYSKYKETVKGICNLNPTIIDFIKNTIHHQGAFICRDLFDQYGLYSTDYRIISDWKFFFEVVAIAHERIRYVNQNIAYFRMDGISSKNTNLCYQESIDYLSNCYGDEICAYLLNLKDFKNCLLSRFFLNLKNKCRQNVRIYNISKFIKSLIPRFG